MSANEKLGISIEINEVTVAGDLASKISTKVQDLGKDVKPVSVGVTAGDMSGVVAELQKIAAAMKSLTGESEKTASGFKATKAQLDLLKDYWKMETVEQVKNHLSKMKNMEEVQKIIGKDLEQKKKSLTEGSAAEKKAADISIAEANRVAEAKRKANDLELQWLSAKDARARELAKQSQGLNIAPAASYSKWSPAISDKYLNEQAMFGGDANGMLAARDKFLALQNAVTKSSVGVNPFKELLKDMPALGSSLSDVNAKLNLTSTAIKALTPTQITNLTAALHPFKIGIDSVNGSLKDLKGNNSFSFLGESLGKMASRLAEFYSIRTVIFAVSSQFRDATQAALDFNQNIHDIIAISGESREGLNNIGQSIWDIAKASRFSAKEIADLMQVLAQAGVKAAELPSVAKSVGMFATGAGADPKLAADLFTTSMNVFEIKAENSMRITNALTAALNNSKLEAGGLATAFNYLAPQAAQLGMSLESTLGIISTMAQSGVKASTIGTGVSQMLKEFAAPKGRLRNLLEYYGLTPENINPLKHSFAEIVDSLNNAKGKAGETGVAVSHLFSALESRVGRSAIAAINLGGDAFRNMENSVTGTSSALVAYEKSMEGARAQLNVLKQTFHEFASDTLSKLAPAFIVATQALRGFLNIMNTEGGKTLGVVIAITTAVGGLAVAAKGLSAWAATSSLLKGGGLLASLIGGISGAPILAIAAVIAGVSAAIVGIGFALDRNKQKEEEGTKKTLEAVEAKQKMIDVINSIRTSMERTNPEIKKYQELLLVHGEKDAQVVALGNTKVKLTQDQTNELKKLIAKFPELFAGMDTELDKVSGLTNAYQKLNRAKFGKSEDAAKEYESKLDAAKVAYDAEMKRLRTLGPVVDSTNNKAINDYRATVKGLETLKEEIYSNSFSRPTRGVDKKGKPIIETGVMSYMPVSREEVPGVPISRPILVDRAEKPLVDLPGTFNPNAKKGNVEKPVNFKEALDEVKQAFGKEAAAAIVQIAKDRATEAKDMLKDATTQADHDFIVNDYTDALDQVMLDSMSAAQNKARETIAGKIKATYNDNTKEYTWHGDRATENRNNYLQNRAGFDEEERARMQSAEAAAASLRAKALGTLPDFKETKETTPSTARLAKEADFALRVTSQRLALEKEGVWTAQEREKIEVQMAEATLNNSEKKAVIYQAEIDFWNKKKVLKDDEKAKLESAVDLHAETLELIKQQAAEVAKIQSMNPWSSFKDGARGAWTQQTDINAQSKQLGGNLLNTGINGISDSIFSAMNPDKQKIAETKATINELNIKKSELEDSIATSSANTNRTAAETNSLNEKKIALTGINASLREQQDALKAQTNGWQNFASSMKKVMVQILEELQKYIIKMMVVAMVQRAIGLFASSTTTTGAGDLGTGGTSVPYVDGGSGGVTVATGGLITSSGVQRFAAGGMMDATPGGFVPKLPGTQWGVDGIPALIAPGEVVLRKEAVDFYSASKLLALNNMQLPKFSGGGLVGGGGASSNNSEKPYEIHIYNIADPNSIPRQQADANEILNIISFSAAERGIMHKVIKGTMQA